MSQPSRPEQFQRLLELSQQQLDELGKKLHAAIQVHTSATQQLQQLQLYHQEYTERLNQERQQGCSMTNYRNFLRFIGTLETAISEQNTKVVHLSAQRAEIQQQWHALRQRCKAYETLIERSQQAAQYEANRLEQRHNDEIASQLAHRARTPHS